MENRPSQSPYQAKPEKDSKESYFALLRKRRMQQRIERARARMQRMRLVMNMASLALVFTAKSPRNKTERAVEANEARRILGDQQRFGRLL